MSSSLILVVCEVILFSSCIYCQLYPTLLQQPQAELAVTGRSFSSDGETGNTSITTLSVNTTAATYLPASLFQSIVNRTNVGVVFNVYNTGVLFPITNATEQVQGTNASITTVVGSPVLGVTVGPGLNFSNLTEPVRILLQLNELEVSDWNMCVRSVCTYISVYVTLHSICP